jgi:hypothetical protein
MEAGMDFDLTTRRRVLQVGGAGAAALALGHVPLPAAPAPAKAPAPGFAQRGYYVTFMRMPTYGLPQWKQALDAFAADGANTLLLWMAGGFRSKKFPITWKFNAEHANVRADFGRELIAYAHGKGIKVLLGFTPFGYDGANQYPLEHPDLKAVGKDGKPTSEFGIYCWGWNLCPSKPQSQRFMLEYVREMLFDFYPDADGLLIESSDYAICHCDQCRGRFFEKEFEFVETISREVWARKPGAAVVVYPHYFSGAKVPGFDVAAATRKFDPRWTLFFTPHSAHEDPRLIRQARASLWSDDSPALRDPEAIRRNARRARDAGLSGYVPSFEAFSYVPTRPEEGQQYLVGKRQVPFGFGWLAEGQMPYNELPVRVNRIAYREFSNDPDLPFEEFKRRLGRDVFGDGAAAQDVEDLLEIHRVFTRERTWCQASPLVSPERVRARKERGELKVGEVKEYRKALDRVRAIADRHAGARGAGARELQRIAVWVLQEWAGENAALLSSATGP